jgi:hypothetical protein
MPDERWVLDDGFVRSLSRSILSRILAAKPIKWIRSASDVRSVRGSPTARPIGGVVVGTGEILSRPGDGVPSVSMSGKIRSVRMERVGVVSGRRIWIGTSIWMGLWRR